MRLDWALDAVIAGAPYRFATRQLDVDGASYLAGLADMTLSKRVDFDATVGLQISTRDDWGARLAAAQWLVDGGTATLWLVITEDDGSARRVLWARGRLEGTQWGRPGEVLSMRLRESFRRLELPNPREKIDSYTAPTTDSTLPTHTGAWIAYPDHHGEFYPIPIGYPGYDDASGVVWPVVPLPVMQYSDDVFTFDSGDQDLPEVYIYVVGVGDIDAVGGDVTATDAGLTLTEETGAGNKQWALSRDRVAIPGVGVYVAEDKLGQRFAYTYQDLSSGYTLEKWGGRTQLYAGFDPTNGGGVLHRGRVVRGGASIFEWIFGAYTDVVIDVGAQAANAPALDAYHFDTFINAPQDCIDWFVSEILEDLPAAIVRGGRGIYLAHVPLRAERPDAAVHLEVGAGGVQWVSMRSGALADVANEITVRWAPQRDGGTYLNTRTLTSEYQRALAIPSGAVYYDTRAVAHALCLASQRAIDEVRPLTIDLPTVWSQATAFRIAADKAIQLAFPEHIFTVSLPVEQHELAVGTVVELSASQRGLSGVLCALEDVRVSSTRIEVDARPTRSLEAYL